MSLDIDAVTRAIEHASRALVLPRFANLSTADVHAKASADDPEDVVTIVDQEVESELSATLTALVPSATVIGEEAVHQRPDLLDRMASSQPLWVIDPIDGTKNFVAGHRGFGIMVAFVVDGHAEAGWVILPALQKTFVAARGSGAFVNGERIRVPASSADPPRGAVFTNYMPNQLGAAVLESMEGRYRQSTPSGCSAVEYTDILTGVSDFVVYYRLYPWDHAAPALILSEAGGRVAHSGGEYYTARSRSRLTMVVQNERLEGVLRQWLAPACRVEGGREG